MNEAAVSQRRPAAAQWPPRQPITRQLIIRRALCAAAALLTVTSACPPWIRTFEAQGIHERQLAGYAWLWDPPEPRKSTYAGAGVSIDFQRLSLEWLALGSLVLTLVCIAGKKHHEEAANPRN